MYLMPLAEDLFLRQREILAFSIINFYVLGHTMHCEKFSISIIIIIDVVRVCTAYLYF